MLGEVPCEGTQPIGTSRRKALHYVDCGTRKPVAEPGRQVEIGMNGEDERFASAIQKGRVR